MSGAAGPGAPFSAFDEEVQRRFERIVAGLAPAGVPGRQGGRSSSQPPTATEIGGGFSVPLTAPAPGSAPPAAFANPDLSFTLGAVASSRQRPRSLPPGAPAGRFSTPPRSRLDLERGEADASGAIDTAEWEALQSSGPALPGAAPSARPFDGAVGAGSCGVPHPGDVFLPPFAGSAPGAESVSWSGSYPAGGGPAGKADGAELRVMFASAFPTMFTLLCLAAFIVPIWTTFHIGQDENVRRWIGRHIALAAWPLPLLYLGTHLLHVYRGAPVKIAVIACLEGSCVLLLVVANCVLVDAYRLGSAFSVRDCYSFQGKQELELEWQQASAYYANCTAELAQLQQLPLADAVAQYRIEDCPEYAAAAGPHKVSWSYLQFLEERYSCAGWCEEHDAIWTRGHTQDACSAAVANVLLGKVQWSMLQVVSYSAMMFLLLCAGLVVGVPLLAQFGVTW